MGCLEGEAIYPHDAVKQGKARGVGWSCMFVDQSSFNAFFAEGKSKQIDNDSKPNTSKH